MKKLIKIIGVLVVILVVAVVGLMVAAKILITPERVRQVVVPRAEEQLNNRQVTIGDVDVRLFSGIVISDFKIGSLDDEEDFVSAQSLVLRYRIWPLLRRMVIVDEIRLISPSIRVERYENGEFNFSDLLAVDPSADDEDPAPVDSTEDTPVEETEGLPIGLLVNEISISGGKLVFMDRMVGREYQLTDLSVALDGVSPERPFPFDVSAKINNAPVRLAGTVNPLTQHVIATARIQDLDVAPFMAYAPEDFPGELSSMTISMDIRADATAEAVDSAGQISIGGIDLLLHDMPDAHVENGRFSIDYDVAVDLVSQNIIISKADADINGILLATAGSVLSYGESPALDITARLPMISLADIVAAVPQKIVEPVLEMRPSGRIGADVHLKGSPEMPEELLQKAEITLEKVRAEINNLAPEITGAINVAKNNQGSGDPGEYIFEVSASLNNAPVTLDGTINPGTRHVVAAANIKDLDVTPFMALAPEDFPGKLGSMKLNVDLRADATEQVVDSAGRIFISEIDFLPNDLPDARIENGRVSLDYDVGVDLVSENITISKAEADINGILLSAKGSILSFREAPQMDIMALLPRISLSDIVAAAPQNLVTPVLEMRPAGNISAQFHLKGSPDKPEAIVEKGEITLEKAGVTINELTPEVSGSIRIIKDGAASDNLVIDLAGSPLRLSLTAENLMGEIKRIQHTLTADILDIDRLLASLGAEEQTPAPPPGDTTGTPEEPGPFDLPLDVKGDVRVAKAVFKGLSIDNFDLQYLLKDNVFTVNHIRGNIAGGTIAGKAEAKLDRKPLSYTADISVQGTQAEYLLNALFPAAANSVYGTFFLNADLKGEGTGWGSISRSLTSNADMNVTNGRLTGSGLAGGLSSFLGTESLEVLNFDSLKGNMNLKDGKFDLDSSLVSDDVRMSPVGTIGLDGSVNLSLDMRLSQNLASGIGGRDLVSALSRGSDGWALIPLKVGGTLWSPRFEVDASAVADQLKERGKEELQQQLQDRVLDRLSPRESEKTDGETDTKERKPLEKELKDTMRRIFD